MEDLKRVYLSTPHDVDAGLLRARLCNVKATFEEQGYDHIEPPAIMIHQPIEAVSMMRLAMLVASSVVRFPRDFERSPVSVAEYNYAYAMDKKIMVDPIRRLLD
ncbi:hypothetical protein [Serratia sp. CC22-02]|uniref:hypothetical protein n=1 Tax=Serratia sp. CC22-02 TaxID=1378076 RepID=UPI0024B73F89|nr:hypothetical protein [Serratia sp. CC22-02]